MTDGGADRKARPAAFVDRDGTVIRERDYLADPAGVALLDGAAPALRRLEAAGYTIVIVTNQSGIARGRYDEEAYGRVAREVEARLRAEGVGVAATYHCPHHPAITGPCECRKPAPGLFLRAARELGLDLARSIYVGDRVRDVEPGLALGGRALLVRTGYGAGEEHAVPPGVRVVDDLAAAASAILDPP